MDWTINLSYAVLLTSFTGSALYLTWQAAGWALEKTGLIRARFTLLKVVMAGFFIPAAYFFLKEKGERREIGRGYLFAKTYSLLLTGKIFTAVWAGGMLLLLALLLRDGWRLHRKNRDLFSCETAVCAQFEEIYKNLGGKGRRLRVYQSYRVASPCMCGLLRPKVILPVQEYKREELQVILTHEIIHYLQGDAVLKWGALLLRTVHFFNPAAWILYRKAQEWSEYACDFRACSALGGNARQYFQIIADIAISSSGETLAAQLSESRHELVARMEKMKKAKKNCRAKFWVKTAAATLTGIVFMTGSLSVYAATLKSAAGYEYLYHLTDFGVEEEYVPSANEHEEYMEYGNGEGIVVRKGKVNVLGHSYSSFEWTVESGELVETDSFTCEKGNTILINISISPNDVTVKTGIILPDGNKKYIEAWGNNTIHEFSVASSGEYKAFVENNSDTSVSVSGCHIFNHDQWDSIMHTPSENGEGGSHTYRIYCTGCGYSQTITIPCNYDESGYHSTPF